MQITTVGLGNLGQLLFFARQQTDGYAKPVGVVPPPIRVGRVLYNLQHLVATIDRIFFRIIYHFDRRRCILGTRHIDAIILGFKVDRKLGRHNH